MTPAAAADPWDAFWPAPTTLSDKTVPSFSPDLTTSADGQRQVAIWTFVKSNDYRAQVATTTDGGDTWNAPVDLDSSGLLGNTSIVGSTDGQRLTAVWNQANPSNLSVRVRQSADGGATWAPAQFISSASNSIPRVAASADGTKATVVWTEQTMTNTLALVSSWNSTTNTWSGPTIVGPNNDEATYPSITSSADGQVVTITWLDSTNRLRSATSTNAGASWSSAKNLSTAGLQAQQADLVTSADGSRIVATWVEDDGSDHVATAFSTDKGATWSTPAALPAWFGNWQPELVATPDAQRLLVSWPATNGQGNTVARTITSKDGGVTWAPFVDATPATSSASEPMIAASSDLQRLTMLWHETPAQETTVRAAVSGDSGQTWSAPKILNKSNGYDYPQTRIVAAADGTPTAAWQQDGPDGFPHPDRHRDLGDHPGRTHRRRRHPGRWSSERDLVGRARRRFTGDRLHRHRNPGRGQLPGSHLELHDLGLDERQRLPDHRARDQHAGNRACVGPRHGAPDRDAAAEADGEEAAREAQEGQDGQAGAHDGPGHEGHVEDLDQEDLQGEEVQGDRQEEGQVQALGQSPRDRRLHRFHEALHDPGQVIRRPLAFGFRRWLEVVLLVSCCRSAGC